MNHTTIPQFACQQQLQDTTRRHFLAGCTTGLGAMYMAQQNAAAAPTNTLGPELISQFAPRAKRVIYLHMVGAPSQLEMFDYKPELKKLDGKDCPDEFIKGKRFAFIQGKPQMLGPQYPFKQHGQSGQWISDRFPEFSKMADDVSFIKTLQTDQFNHGPAQLMVHTGQGRMGFPSIGSWVTWGLGTANQNLPGYIVLLSGGRPPRGGKALWSSGFLPSVYQGVQCRSKGEPVLNVSNPEGVSRDTRRAALDTLNRLNQKSHDVFGDPETLTRIAQYEMAFRMQTAVPEAMDITQEPEHIREMYGAEPGKESFANNCLLARRLAERDVRYIQLYDWGWDSHGASKTGDLKGGFQDKCRQVDRPMYALLSDLKQRGLLEDTLVVWSGEFGRTPMRENRGGMKMTYTGRDHNPEAFTGWIAGGGIKGGMSYGETDPTGYVAAVDPTPLRDLHATMLHQMGFDHHKLSAPFQGLDMRLTGVLPAKVIEPLLA